MPTLRHLYPGGNTALGFFSYFDQLLPLGKAVRIFVLKGGPGVGKSTFMRKIGSHLLDCGLSIEHFHCASDNDSLDGLAASEIGLLIVDGTAPHIVDPKWPGAVDGIINLGDCLDEDGLARHRTEITEMFADITQWFERAYRFLRAADSMRCDSAHIILSHLDRCGLSHATNEMIREYLPAFEGSSLGAERKLFASAITPSGCVCTLSSFEAHRHVCIQGPWTAPTDLVLSRLRDEALRCGLDVESFYCALNPHRLEHLMIPKLDTLFYTINPYHGQDLPADRTLDLNACITLPTPREQALLVDNETMFENLLDRAVCALAKAKEQHDALETHYVNHMNYGRMEEILSETMSRVDRLIL